MSEEVTAPSCPIGAVRIIGVDPGLNVTGWGVVDLFPNGDCRFVACGTLQPEASRPLAWRLAQLGDGVAAEAAKYGVHEAAMELTYVNSNAASSLKLGHARGALMAALARAGLGVSEFTPAEVKKNVAGNGQAQKDQVARMVRLWLGAGLPESMKADSSDALAVALCRARVPAPVSA